MKDRQEAIRESEEKLTSQFSRRIKVGVAMGIREQDGRIRFL